MEFVKLVKLTIFTAEDVMYEDKPLYEAIIEEAQKQKLAGGTVFKADYGYGTAVRGRKYGQIGFFTGMPNLPLIITIVDMKDNIMRLVPFLEKCGNKHFLAMMDYTHGLVTDYTRSHAAELKETFLDGREGQVIPEISKTF